MSCIFTYMFIFKTHTVEQVQASAQELSSTNIVPEVVYEDTGRAVPNSIRNNGSKMENHASSTFNDLDA